MNRNTVFQIATWLVPLIVAIVFHEVAHGLVARRLGDPTAQERGRLSLNPIKHIDPFGTIILPMLLAISHAPVFGWAKPVPVNYALLRNPRRDMVLVALAGPGMNLLLAVVGAIALAATLTWSRAIRTALPRGWLPAMRSGIHLHQHLPRRVQPAARSAVRRRATWSKDCCRAQLAIRFRQIGRYSLLVLMILLLVLPAISPNANVVGAHRLAAGGAYRHRSARDLRHPAVTCSTAGSFSTSRSGSGRPRR